MPQYKVKDNQTGKTITFNWNGQSPPTDSDLEEVFKSATPDTDKYLQSAAPITTATQLNPNAPKRKEDSLPAFLGRMASYTDPVQRAMTPPSQLMSDVKTTLEVGLPILTTPLGGGAVSIPLAGMLAQTGGLLGSSLEEAVGTRPPTPLRKRVQESAGTGLGTAIGQALGVGAGKLLQKTAAPFAKQVDQEMLAIAKKHGLTPAPSEMINEVTTGSNVQKLAEEASSKSLFGAAIIKKQRYNNFQALKSYEQEVLGNIAPETAPTKLKGMLNDAISNNEQTFRDVADYLYKTVDDYSQAIKPSTAPIKQFADKILSSIPETEKLAAGKSGQEATSLVGMLERIKELPDNIPFKDAQFYRSQLLATARADKSPIASQIGGSAKKLSSLFDAEMESASKAAGIPAYQKYKQASDFFRQGKELFNKTIVADLANKEPEQLAKFVFSPKSGEAVGSVEKALDPTTFRYIKEGDYAQGLTGYKIMAPEANNPAHGASFYVKPGEDVKQAFLKKLSTFEGAGIKKNLDFIRLNTTNDSWQRFKRASLQDLFESKVFTKVSGQTGDEFLRGANLYETLKGYGNETLNAWMTPTEKDAVFKFAKLASRINTKEPTIGLWGMGQLNLASMSLLGGGIAGEPTIAATTAGAILGGPAMYAKLITSPVGRKWLTEGYKITPGTQEAIRFANRFMGWWQSNK